MILERSIALPDGRQLAVAEFGDPNGQAVFYFHGSPSSRLEPELIGDATFRRHGLRVIAADRPGMGGSDRQPGRRITDWPADVAALADALKLPSVSLLGNSGGAPYVAVCAARMPARIRRAVIVSGGWRMDWPEVRAVPLVNRLVFFLARRAPFLLRGVLASMGAVATGDSDRELAQMRKRMPPPDVTAFSQPGRLEAFAGAMRECLRQGTAGAAADLQLYVRDFGFDPTEVAVPIHWFHGTADRNAPLALAERVVSSLPAAHLVRCIDEAHLSTFTNHFDEVAAVLKSGDAR